MQEARRDGLQTLLLSKIEVHGVPQHVVLTDEGPTGLPAEIGRGDSQAGL